MHFEDRDPGYGVAVASERDATFDTVQEEDAMLGDFLKRPVRIYADRWQTADINSQINATFNPWTLFCENAAVFEKIKYYNNLSGDLHIKFVINGNAFLYGRLMASYEPVTGWGDMQKSNLFERDYIEYSQRPKIFLNPTSNEGGTMTLPFFWYNNYLNIPAADWNGMGEITLSELTKLRHALGSVQSVNLTVYAHMENVKLATPTALQAPFLISQGKKTKTTKKKSNNDEYGTGAISKPASAVAAAAGWLTDLPVIGPYARATEIAATKVGAVAKIFGYSRPPDLDAAKRVKTVSTTAFAVTDQPDAVMKLTLDSKNETTIDARTVGLSAEDHMGIYDIAQKESFLTSTIWSSYPLGGIPGTILFNSDVTPALCDAEDLGNTIFMTPMAFMSQLFEYWHGSIIFRFQIVASNFHKGRLLVQYDPNGYLNTSENVQYTEVIDIAETRDFEMCIGWGKSEPFLRIDEAGSLDGQSTPIRWRNDGSTAPVSLLANGQITISVLNELVVPGDPAEAPPIQLNVFVKAGDDMKFAVPDSDKIRDLSLTPLFVNNSRLMSQSEVTTDATTNKQSMENSPEETMKLVLNTEKGDTDQYMNVFFGEHITSLRTLFKRYCHHITWDVPGSDVDTNALGHTCVNKAYPMYRASFDTVGHGSYGYVAIGGNSYSVNPCSTFPLTYCAPAFVGYRGSIRRKVVNNNPKYENSRMILAVRQPYRLQTPAITTTFYDSVVDFTKSFNSAFTHAANGMELQLTRNTGCIEIESPFYQPMRFRSTRYIRPMRIPSEALLIETYQQRDTSSMDTGTFQSDFVSTGEDFTLFFFLSVPRYYRWDLPTEQPSARAQGIERTFSFAEGLQR